MKRGQSVRSYGPSGLASVTVAKKAAVVKMAESRIVYEFPLDNIPDDLKMSGFKSGELFVQLSDDSTRVTSARPWSGKYEVVTDSFGNDESTPPAPRRDQTPGKKYDKETKEVIGTFPRDFLKFTAHMKIVGDKCKGLTILGPLLYFNAKTGCGFAPDGHGGTLLAGKGKDVQKVDDYLQANGVGDLNFPFSDNLLPPIAAAIKAKGKHFAVTVENSWPTAYEPILQAKKKK